MLVSSLRMRTMISACVASRYAHCYRRVCIPKNALKGEQQSVSPAFHNRQLELAKFGNMLSTQPSGITVVLGPRSCGKTALLERHLKDYSKVVYLDCRLKTVNTPEAFVVAFLERLLRQSPKQAQTDLQQKLQQALSALALLVSGLNAKWEGLPSPATLGIEDISLNLVNLANTWLSICKRENIQPDIQVLYDGINAILDAWMEPCSSQDGFHWPVLVIDDANKLQTWRDDHNSQMAELLAFLVQISKQSRRCHVILATSEYALQSSLDEAIGPFFWTPIVIGDFTEDCARKFLEHELERMHEFRQKQMKNGSCARLDDATWKEVYKVCGGNAGNLVRLVAVLDGGNWNSALRTLWTTEWAKVRRLSRGNNGEWTRAQYAEVAIQLLDAEHHALPRGDVELILGRHMFIAADKSQQQDAGELVLMQMVKANALSLRPFSDWAQDIPIEAFGTESDVVTAPATIDLYCMGLLRDIFQNTLEKWQSSHSC